MSSARLFKQFANIVGSDNLVTAADEMAHYLLDTRKRYHGKARCLVRPATTKEVAAIVQLCSAERIPMLAQGGNTSHCGASIPDTSGETVVIQLVRMNHIRAIDPANNTLTAEAGCILHDLQEAANAAKRFFPLSLAAEGSCQIGGNLSTNAGGVQVLRYGNTRELTLGLEVVLPNGDIWDGLRSLRKDNTGYDLKQLFIGAEGTLGIITAAVLKLFPQAQASLTAWLAIASPQHALYILNALQERFGASLTACELISDLALQIVLQHIPQTRAPLAASPYYLLIELANNDEASLLRDNVEAFLGTLAEKELISDAVVANSKQQSSQLWRLRESISEAQKAEGASIKHDISLPISRLPEFISTCGKALTQTFAGIRIVTFGHVGDGNLHYNQSMPNSADNAELMARQGEVNRLVHDLVHQFQGSISAEHGIGQLKRDELVRYKSPVELALMRSIKTSIDPLGLLNPGKVLSIALAEQQIKA